MLVSIIVEFVTRLMQLAWIWGALVVLEALWPAHHVSVASRLRGLALSTVSLLLAVVIAVAVRLALAAVGVKPLFTILFHPSGPAANFAVTLGGTVFSMLMFDFLYYWQHRAHHQWFWPIHAVHHSIRELSAVNAYGHWLEEVVRIPLLTIPLLLLVPSGVQVWPWVTAFLTLQSFWVHTPTRLHLGPFWRLVYDPRFHRIHHSAEQRHYNKNFGVLTPLWDWAFGTLYVPAKDEWPQTGLADQPEVTGLGDFLWRPFRFTRRA